MENSIPMGENERLVKNYPIQDYTIPKVKSRFESQVIVTNKRIVYAQKITDKKGGTVYTKREFNISTIDTVDSDFAFKKIYNVGLIFISAIIALAGIYLLATEGSSMGYIPLGVGSLFIILAIAFAKKCYSFNLVIHAFGSAETEHIHFGAIALKSMKEKKKKAKKKRRVGLLGKLFSPLKRMFKPKAKNIGLFPDSIEAMVAEIGSYIVEFKK